MGDYSNEQCGLPYIQFRALRDGLPKFWLREFDALDDVSIFHRLDGALFGSRDGIEVANISPQFTRKGLLRRSSRARHFSDNRCISSARWSRQITF